MRALRIRTGSEKKWISGKLSNSKIRSSYSMQCVCAAHNHPMKYVPHTRMVPYVSCVTSLFAMFSQLSQTIRLQGTCSLLWSLCHKFIQGVVRGSSRLIHRGNRFMWLERMWIKVSKKYWWLASISLWGLTPDDKLWWYYFCTNGHAQNILIWIIARLAYVPLAPALCLFQTSTSHSPADWSVHPAGSLSLVIPGMGPSPAPSSVTQSVFFFGTNLSGKVHHQPHWEPQAPVGHDLIKCGLP